LASEECGLDFNAEKIYVHVSWKEYKPKAQHLDN
jgi:hypothetical protein